MGQTLTDIQTGSLRKNWVLLIEGCEIALCDYPNPSTLTSLFTGTSAADWTDAVNGLCVLGGWEQSLQPWEPGIQVGRLTFSVQKGIRASTSAQSDIFAELVFGNGNGAETFLTTALDCNDTTIAVKSTSAFSSSGTVHIGNEAISYTGKTATTFTGCTRGKWSPLGPNGATNRRFGQMHRITAFGDGIAIQPKVTSKQRDWRGRRVGLWMVSSNSTWAGAQCVWAGRIESIRDGSNGLTYMECADIKAQLKECEILRHQFSGKIQEGIYLFAGQRFGATDIQNVDLSGGTSLTANELKVVSSSPGTNEILEGKYTLDELADEINAWLTNEEQNSRLNFRWIWVPVTADSNGVRSKFLWSNAPSTGLQLASFVAPPYVIQFMGFRSAGESTSDGRRRVRTSWENASSYSRTSPEEPRRTIINGNALRITLDNLKGDLFDNRPYLPNLGWAVPSGEQWGVFQLGGSDGPFAMFEIESESSTEVVLFGGISSPVLDAIAGTPWEGLLSYYETSNGIPEIMYSDERDLTVRQIALISGKMANVTTKMLASTGTSGYNHATYDAYPQQLGAALPWDLLGTNWTTSLSALDSEQAFITLCVRKPTKLMSVIGTEFVVRVAQIIWKDQGLRVTSWGTPTAARALHAFTESNKAIPYGTKDAQRTVANQTDEFLVNRIRLNYGFGDLENHWSIIDPSSQDTYGQFGKEIDLRSIGTPGGISGISRTLEGMVPFFSRPMHLLRRSISPQLWENVAPGDFATISDNHARDPATGQRGLSSKACLVVRHSVDWGGFDDSGALRPPSGEVDLLVLPLANIAVYSPCAQVNDGAANGGYDSATKTLTFKANEHSEAGVTTDLASFAASDSVSLLEIDPADPASHLSWNFTIASVNTSNNTIVHNGSALAGWDSAKKYRMVSRIYSSAVASQKTDVYQADDADGMILDTAGAYVYGTDITQAGTWTNDTGEEQVALHSNSGYGDGVPLDTGYEKDLARVVNSLVNRRTAIMCPVMERSVLNAVVTVKRIIAIYPISIHPGRITTGDRLIYVRPMFRSNDGTSVTLSVSVCSMMPTGTSLEMGDADAPAYRLGGNYETKTWTTTLTTWSEVSSQAFSAKVCNSALGHAYVVLESNSTKLECRGLSEFWLQNYDEDA